MNVVSHWDAIDMSDSGSTRRNSRSDLRVEGRMTTQPDLYDVVTRGRMLLAAGDPTTAAGMLTQAAALAPTDRAVHTDLAAPASPPPS